MILIDINACVCSYCEKYKSHISYDSRGKSICADCRRKKRGGNKITILK